MNILLARSFCSSCLCRSSVCSLSKWHYYGVIMGVVGAMSKSFGMRARVVMRVNCWAAIATRVDRSQSWPIHSLCQLFTKFTKFTKIILLLQDMRVSKIECIFSFFFFFRKKLCSRYARGRSNRGNYESCRNNEQDHSGYECLMRVNCDAIVIRIDWNNRCSSLLQTFKIYKPYKLTEISYTIIKI